MKTVRDWLDETGSDMKVSFNVFKDKDLEIYSSLLKNRSGLLYYFNKITIAASKTKAM